MSNIKDISRVIDTKREMQGLAYSELARRTNLSEELVGRLCEGISMPSGEQLLQICAVLGLESVDFIPTRIEG